MIARAPMSEDYRVVRILLASLSFSYAAAELIIGWWIGSVSLLADSVQFLENGFLVLLSIAAIDRPVRLSAGTAGLLTGLIQAPAVAALGFSIENGTRLILQTERGSL